MKTILTTLSLCTAISTAVFLSACGSSSSSGFDNYGVGGCLNQVAMNLAVGETCKLVDSPTVGFTGVYTCRAGGLNDLDFVSTRASDGQVVSTLSGGSFSLVRDAAHGGGSTTLTCN